MCLGQPGDDKTWVEKHMLSLLQDIRIIVIPAKSVLSEVQTISPMPTLSRVTITTTQLLSPCRESNTSHHLLFLVVQ
jgi:hypothetical protein